MSKRYEVVDLNTLHFVKRSRNELIFLCDFCIEEGHSDDKKGTLYYNEEKQCGHCWSCGTVVFTEREFSCTEVPQYAKGYNEVVSSFDIREEFLNLEAIQFDFPSLNEECLDYLRGRNPFLPQLAEFLGLKAWYGKEVGVVVPFRLWEKIVSFQTRFIHKREGGKYFTSPGTKPLFSPENIFWPTRWRRHINVTLCEGVYDAIALMCMGYPCPLACLGSSLTSFQLYMLRKLVPECILCCYDKKSISRGVIENVKNHLPSVQKFTIINDWESSCGDPEDFFRSLLEGNVQYKEEFVLQGIQRLLSGA